MIAIDLFCGGGGVSAGIQAALGVSPRLAVNHCPSAIEMHRANHPESIHIREDVLKVDPERVLALAVGTRDIDLLWLSPDCTHFSRARGGKPRRKDIRGLAWSALEWARSSRPPRVIILENVREFVTWGPLDDEGHIVQARAGETFQEFVRQLQAAGYTVDWRVLNAADFGAPTSRRRLFLVARRDGEPIGWPEPTHGPDRPEPYRTAAECIDWSLPCPSIFERTRPLAEATQRRIAEGLRRYVLEAEQPFLLNLTHGGRLEPVDEPLRTVTGAHRGEKALVTPYVARIGQTGGSGGYVYDLQQPLTTITSKAEHLLVAPFLTRYHGEKSAGERPRVEPVSGLVPTLTTERRFGLVAAFLAKHNRGATGQPVSVPLHTVTGRDTKAVVAATILRHQGRSIGQPTNAPLSTIVGSAKHSLVAAFLLKYYGQGGQWAGLGEPMHTIVQKARMGLVTVLLAGEEYVLADIGMRMLEPRELATAQGFPEDYVLTGTKTEQIARVGNSVPPQVVAAVVGAQFPAVARGAA